VPQSAVETELCPRLTNAKPALPPRRWRTGALLLAAEAMKDQFDIGGPPAGRSTSAGVLATAATKSVGVNVSPKRWLPRSRAGSQAGNDHAIIPYLQGSNKWTR